MCGMHVGVWDTFMLYTKKLALWEEKFETNARAMLFNEYNWKFLFTKISI